MTKDEVRIRKDQQSTKYMGIMFEKQDQYLISKEEFDKAYLKGMTLLTDTFKSITQ